VGLPLRVGGCRHPVNEVYADELYESFPSLQRFEDSEHRLERFLSTTPAFIGPFGQDVDEKKSMPSFAHLSATSSMCASNADIPDGMLRLGARLVIEVARARPGEGILVFLSGLAEIEVIGGYLKDFLANDDTSGAAEHVNVRVSVLHSFVDLADQAATFDHVSAPVKLVDALPGLSSPRAAFTHVVLATNLAESSLTLPNLRTVVDFGVHKEVAHAEKSASNLQSHGGGGGGGEVWRTGVSTLRKVWVSRASARQRAGRAGRVAPGTVYRLYPRIFFERGMEDWDTVSISWM
jgi:HrpA-like RNA helicase